MKVLLPYTILLSLFICVAWGLSVESVTYSIHTVQVDNNNNFKAALFSFSFDQDIKFVNISDPTKTLLDHAAVSAGWVNVCFPPLDCMAPPNISSNLYDLVTLNCSSEIVHSSPWHRGDVDGLSPPSYMLLFGGSPKDPLLNFFAQMGILDINYQTAINRRMLYAFMLLSYTEKGTPYLFGGRYRTIESELERCTFQFEQDALYYLSSQDISAQPFYQSVTGIKLSTPPKCTYFESLAISTSIYSLISSMTYAPDWKQLQKLQFEGALLESSDTIVACKSLISGYMTYESRVITFPSTTDCLRSVADPLYSSDPCCNTTLRFHYCCAPTEKNISTQVLKSVDAARATCRNAAQSSGLLNDFVINTNNAEDPVTGCRATAATIANNDIVDKYTNYIDKCLNLIYGSDLQYGFPPSCVNDSDCFTWCNMFNECGVDWSNPDSAMLDCHMQMIDPQVVTLLKAEWKLPRDTTDEEFRETYLQQMSSENCVGYDAMLYTWRRDAKGELKWINTRKDACVTAMYCNYEYSLSEDECTRRDEVCVYNDTGVGHPMTFPTYCYIYATRIKDCDDLGGVWDAFLSPWSCILPNTSREDCIPDWLCPPNNNPGLFTEMQCEDSICFDRNIAESECVQQCGAAVLYQWNNYTVDGIGFCEILVFSESDCYDANGTWWHGRGWNKGNYLTKDTCENSNDTCSVGEIILFGADCSAESCTSFCHICDSVIGNTLCYADNMTYCECTIAKGTYHYTYNLCLFEYSASETCESHGLTWASCQSLTKEQCNACTAGDNSTCPQYHSLLECQFAWNTPCENKEKCLNVGGDCSDPFFNYDATCDSAVPFSSPNCLGSCVHDLIPFPSGSWGCPSSEVYTPLGCIDKKISSEAKCQKKHGYHWQPSFTNKQDCEWAKGCQSGTSLNLQNQEQCSQCKGDYESIFKWNPARWVPAHQMELHFIKANYTTINSWKRTLDFQILKDTVNRVVAENFALALETEAMCLYNPLLDVINHIACDCTGDASAPPDCYPEGTRITSVGVQRFYAGNSDSIKAGSVKLTVYTDSIPIATAYLDINIDIVSASQFRQEQTLSINVLSSSFNTNPYAIVRNAHKVVVGQLVGDGVVLSFLPANFKRDVESRADPSFVLQNPMQLCIQLRSDISHSDKDFPVPDIAIPSADFKTWTPIETAVTITTDGYCFYVERQGTYFPVLRATDWTTRKNKAFIEDKAVLAFIYIFGIVFILLSFISAYQIWVAAHAHSVSRAQKLNLALVLFIFMFLFNMVRGLYLLIFPSGRLEHNEGAKYFLSEAPQFFFFSVYSVIIFLWAELSVMVTSHQSFLYHFKWPFILTNVGLYVLFIVVVSTYHALTPSHQVQLQKAYVYILAICCLVAVIAFNVFGRKLIITQLRGSETKTNLKDRDTLRRMILTLVVSSVTLIGQIIFLFIVTYSTVSPGLALMAYVLTEVIPSATLVYTLRPLSS